MSQLTAKPNLRSNMHLRFVDRRFPAASAADDLTREAYASMGSLPEGLPILLDDRWRPVEPWLTYFRVVGATTDRSTIRNYGYDAHRFASYLDSRGTDVVHAKTEDIHAYREWRLRESSRPISPSTWRREVVVIRGIFQLLTQTGVLQREPWITIGRTSVRFSHRGVPWE